MILYGRGNNCASRMSSLLPAPLGCGGRNNAKKRDYLLHNIQQIDYRTIACHSEPETKNIERQISTEHVYLFST